MCLEFIITHFTFNFVLSLFLNALSHYYQAHLRWASDPKYTNYYYDISSCHF